MTSGEMVTVIAAVGLVLVQVITAWRTSTQVQGLKESTERTAERVEEKAEVLKETTERTAAVADKKLDAIHELTNSNLVSVKSDLSIANDRIAKLESMLEEVVAESANKGNKTAASAKITEETKRRTMKKE